MSAKDPNVRNVNDVRDEQNKPGNERDIRNERDIKEEEQGSINPREQGSREKARDQAAGGGREGQTKK